VWLQDLDVWAAGTELQQEQQAPAVVQRLGGAARELARVVPTTQLRDGRVDAVTGVITSGLAMLVQGLERRFGQFAVETSTRVIIDLLGFRRRQTESIDEALARFETARGQVQAQATGFDLPTPVLAWLPLEALHIPRRTWPLVLSTWQGRLPEDDAALRELLDSIRHQGHIAESPHAGSHSWTQRSHFAEKGADTFFEFPSSGGLPLTEGDEEWYGEGGEKVFFDQDG